MLISYWTYIHLCLVINNQRHYKYIFFIIIDRLQWFRLHVNFDILVILFSLFLYMFFDAAQIGYKYVSVVIIPRI